MKVFLSSLLCLFLLLQTTTAQDAAINGISKISGMDVIVVEDPLDSLSYNADLKKLGFVSKNTELSIEDWSDEWLVALSPLVSSDKAMIQSLSLTTPENIMMKSQGQFRMSGPFEMITLYEKTSEVENLDESSFLLFIGNDIPLKLTWIPEFEGKIKTIGVVEGKLELTQNDQTYLVSPNEITPLENNFCTYLMALNESETSDITGRKVSEWRFDVALFKCEEAITDLTSE